MQTYLAAQGELPDPSIVGPGMLGFVVFLGLIVAAVFLFRSLNKQIKRVDFPEPADDSEPSKAKRQTTP
ncbi:MAG: hypothetical protein R2720_06265 [Candidatus Nanopelagicales bacterium]